MGYVSASGRQVTDCAVCVCALQEAEGSSYYSEQVVRLQGQGIWCVQLSKGRTHGMGISGRPHGRTGLTEPAVTATGS